MPNRGQAFQYHFELLDTLLAPLFCKERKKKQFFIEIGEIKDENLEFSFGFTAFGIIKTTRIY